MLVNGWNSVFERTSAGGFPAVADGWEEQWVTVRFLDALRAFGRGQISAGRQGFW
jgi:hypothetical protein